MQDSILFHDLHFLYSSSCCNDWCLLHGAWLASSIIFQSCQQQQPLTCKITHPYLSWSSLYSSSCFQEWCWLSRALPVARDANDFEKLSLFQGLLLYQCSFLVSSDESIRTHTRTNTINLTDTLHFSSLVSSALPVAGIEAVNVSHCYPIGKTSCHTCLIGQLVQAKHNVRIGH